MDSTYLKYREWDCPVCGTVLKKKITKPWNELIGLSTGLGADEYEEYEYDWNFTAKILTHIADHIK